MRYAALVLAMIALPCAAGQVYKCKGPNGEVTFTNIKCPEKTEATQIGTYEKAADSPDQLRDALSDAAARRARENAAQDVSALSADTQLEDTSDAAAAATRDRRSIAGRQQIDTEAASDAAKDAKYRADLKRWGKRMAGEPPPGYEERAASRRGRGNSEDERHVPADATARRSEPVSCKQNSGNVDCFNSDGTFSYGHVNPVTGAGAVYDQNGNATTIRRDPLGHPETDNGTCVKDIYGNCQ